MKKVMAASMISLVSHDAYTFGIDPPEKRVPVSISTASDKALFTDDTRYSVTKSGEKIPVKHYSVCISASDIDQVHHAFLKHDPYYKSEKDVSYVFPDHRSFYIECAPPEGLGAWIDYTCFEGEKYVTNLHIPSKNLKEQVDNSEYKCDEKELTFISYKAVKKCDNISVSVSPPPIEL